MNCFLLYSNKTNPSAARRLLSDNNINIVDPIDIFNISMSSQESAIQNIQNSDFVFCLLSTDPGILFETGLALGLKKPIFLVVEENNKAALSFISDLTVYTVSNHDDYERIKYNFNIFINKTKFTSNKKQSTLITNIKYYNKNKINISDTKDQGPSEFTRSVEALLNNLNIDVIAQNHSKGRNLNADFSIWVNELDASIGNPIIIETKFKPSYDSLKRTVALLAKHTESHKAKASIIIYNGKNTGSVLGRDVDKLQMLNPLILLISFENLIDKLVHKSFSQVIIELRNKAAHNIYK